MAFITLFPTDGFVWGKTLSNTALKALRVLTVIVAMFLISIPLLSQSSQGTIQGAIFDQSGGAIPGASVALIDVARGVTRTLTTDSVGEYIATNLTPGTYTVRGEAKGFQTTERTGVQVQVGQNIRVDFTLQPGQQSQTITVTVKSQRSIPLTRLWGELSATQQSLLCP
jgi:hypothetical protein